MADRNSPNILDFQGPNFLDCSRPLAALSGDMPRAAKKEVPPDSQAARMTRLRVALGYDNQVAFAAFVGVDSKRWNNFERGNQVSVEVAKLLVQRIPGLSMDWIYLGSTRGLTLEMATKLGTAGRG